MAIPLRNIYKMATASLAAKFFGTRVPLNIMLSVTDRCTGRCAICKIPERKRPEMNLDQIRTLLDQATEMGCQRLGIWGGEPLIRKDLDEIIRHAKDLGLFVTVDTNGHLIPQSDAALFWVDHLNITLDGDREAHDAVRGRGTFEKTMAGIRHASGRYKFWTITVLSKANLDQVDWLLEQAKKYRFQTTFQALHHNEQIGCNDDFRPDPTKLRAVAVKLMELKRSGAPIASSMKYLRHLRDWPDYSQERTHDYLHRAACQAGRLYCNVDTDGSLYPCSLFIDEMESPNARELGFRRAFEKLSTAPCGSCLAACFTEYNLLYGLDLSTGINWVRALRS